MPIKTFKIYLLYGWNVRSELQVGFPPSLPNESIESLETEAYLEEMLESMKIKWWDESRKI